jgi:hypothetical protein
VLEHATEAATVDAVAKSMAVPAEAEFAADMAAVVVVVIVLAT